MELKENLGLILIVIGLLISLTMVGAWIGVPIAAIGVYLLNKKVNQPGQTISDELKAKKEELDNIDEKLKQMEKDKEEEINQKLADKQNEIDNIDEKLKQMEKDKEEEINQKLADKQRELDNINEKYKSLEQSKKMELDLKLKDRREEVKDLNQEASQLKQEVVLLRDEVEMQSYGIYEPKYDFVNATAYKEKLDEIRKKQKQLIKDKKAAWAKPNMTLNGDARKGQALMNDNVKQIIRTFNTECDGIIRKVKHSNIEASEKRIRKSYETLNKLNERLGVRIEQRYLDLKIEELYLAYEYEVKKQEEKEMLAEAREREREEKKLRKKLEKEKNKFNRENERITNELTDAEAKLQAANDEEKARLEAEIAELKAALEKNNDEIEKIDKWEETPGAGYVYIISNIGSFGEDVFKIGVTRRDDPEERIRELSNASVPFKYDSHVFIFSEDAYNLESSLHERFDNKRVNKVNRRKEFFNITIDDVKKIVEENKASVHSFVEQPEAEEYYDSLKMAEMP